MNSVEPVKYFRFENRFSNKLEADLSKVQLTSLALVGLNQDHSFFDFDLIRCSSSLRELVLNMSSAYLSITAEFFLKSLKINCRSVLLRSKGKVEELYINSSHTI